MIATYGMLDFNFNEPAVENKTSRPQIYIDEYIRVELRNGYDKQYLKRIVEVLINDTEAIK